MCYLKWHKNSPASRYAARSISAHDVPLSRTSIFTESANRCNSFGTTPTRPTHSHFSAADASASSDLPGFIVERQQPKHSLSHNLCRWCRNCFPSGGFTCVISGRFCTSATDSKCWYVQLLCLGSLTTFEHGIRHQPLLTSKHITSIAFLCCSMKDDGTCSLVAVRAVQLPFCYYRYIHHNHSRYKER